MTMAAGSFDGMTTTTLPTPTSRASRFVQRRGWTVGVGVLFVVLLLWRVSQLPRFGAFEIRTTSGEVFFCRKVILAIGVQGNLRKLGVAGEDLPQVQYQLDHRPLVRPGLDGGPQGRREDLQQQLQIIARLMPRHASPPCPSRLHLPTPPPERTGGKISAVVTFRALFT